MKSNERLFIAGQTGSGKSYLATHLTKDWPHLVAFDEKRRLELPGAKIITTIKELRKAKGGRYMFFPDPLEMGEPKSRAELVQAFFRTIYERQNTMLFIDEIYSVAESPLKTPPALRAVVTQGRQLNIGIVALVQRPAMIPIFLFSEAEHLATFCLSFKKDRQRMSELMGDEELDFADLGDHEFYYYAGQTRQPAAKLKI